MSKVRSRITATTALINERTDRIKPILQDILLMKTKTF